MTGSQTIPVLDLQDFRSDQNCRAAFINNLKRALQEIRFFALVNHGVDAALIRSAYAAAESFFTLPDAIKGKRDRLRKQGISVRWVYYVTVRSAKCSAVYISPKVLEIPEVRI